MTLLPLPQLLDLLRSKGVRAFTQDGEKLHIEFNAPEALPVEEPASSPSEGPPEKCACGHLVYEHINGLCMHCPPEKCVDKAAAS